MGQRTTFAVSVTNLQDREKCIVDLYSNRTQGQAGEGIRYADRRLINRARQDQTKSLIENFMYIQSIVFSLIDNHRRSLRRFEQTTRSCLW